jgi:hypothetical protein
MDVRLSLTTPPILKFRLPLHILLEGLSLLFDLLELDRILGLSPDPCGWVVASVRPLYSFVLELATRSIPS